jgi:hypothetical protein
VAGGAQSLRDQHFERVLKVEAPEVCARSLREPELISSGGIAPS